MGQGIRTSIGMLAAGCVALAAVGCGAAHVVGPSKHETLPGVTLARGVAAVEPTADPRPFGAADTAFGLDVLRAWCGQYPGRNLVFSPSTLASALGMAYLGARGDTAAVMARVLHLPASGGTALAAGLQARSAALTGLSGPGVTLAASNQVWADPTLQTLRGYLNSVATGYGAGVAQAPFSTDPAKAAAEIDNAISAETRGHITRLVTPDMLAQIGWVLTSALYLDAKWATAFDPNKTSGGQFALAGGRQVTAKFLNGSGYKYATAGGWTGVALPYKGGRLTMTALLPPAGAAACALPAQPTLGTIAAGLRKPASVATMTTVSMPKISLNTSGRVGDMRSALTTLGMGKAFTDTADFTRLSPQAGKIGFVQQAATLDVAEKGTVGAAAAAVGITASSAELPTHTVTFDRPYLLLITAAGTGEPLFLAEVANPTTS